MSHWLLRRHSKTQSSRIMSLVPVFGIHGSKAGRRFPPPSRWKGCNLAHPFWGSPGSSDPPTNILYLYPVWLVLLHLTIVQLFSSVLKEPPHCSFCWLTLFSPFSQGFIWCSAWRCLFLTSGPELVIQTNWWIQLHSWTMLWNILWWKHRCFKEYENPCKTDRRYGWDCCMVIQKWRPSDYWLGCLK